MKIFFKIVFSRTAIVFLMLIMQVLVLFGCFYWLEDYSFFVSSIFNLLSALLVIYIMNRRGNPAFKLSWIIPILIFPVFGALLYLFVQLNFEVRIEKKRHESILKETAEFLKQNDKVTGHLQVEDPYIANTAEYMKNYGGYPIYENTEVTYFPIGEKMLEELREQLLDAKEFIFMEYFIVHAGVMWDEILDILKQKVKAGVEVRFMYDGMCSIMLVPYKYPKKLQAMGIKCKQFAPIKPVLSTHQNNRDHRKICVIDGKVAFTGGINMSDEYININSSYGHWKDTAVMLEGDAVKSFTLMFLQMWNITEKGSCDYAHYFRKDVGACMEKTGCGYVMPYGDSPLDDENVGEQVYLDILHHARHYVHIMTPYLILDNEMVTALTHTAKSGVEVILILPHIPDKIYAYMVARTYYRELIEEDVKIYEYTPGFVHAKSFVSDDCVAVVGTINLDFRSLYHHFECASFMYKNMAVEMVEEDFQKTLEKCQLITVEDCKNYSITKRLMGEILRLFGPLM